MDKLTKVITGMKTVFTAHKVKHFLIPLVRKIIDLNNEKKTIIIGVQGGQGTGKTTVAVYIRQALTKMGYQVQAFSIDDFYQTFKARMELQEKLPGNFFYQISRGMPGTHRVKFLKQTLQKIKEGKPFEIPIFEKSLHHAQGDVLKKTIKVKKRPDFIIFEGWFLGMPSVSSKVLQAVCKKNEIDLKKNDPELKDHKVVLKFAKDYQLAWKYIDYFVMLQSESSHSHQKWRYQKEKEMKERTGEGMTKKEIDNYVEPFLPFTYLCYEKVKPDVRYIVGKGHKILKTIT